MKKLVDELKWSNFRTSPEPEHWVYVAESDSLILSILLREPQNRTTAHFFHSQRASSTIKQIINDQLEELT